MVDDTLSEALLTYVWGTNGRRWPSRDADGVQEKFGDVAVDLIARIQTVFALVDATEVDWSSADLGSAADRIASLVRSAHPELRADAVRAVRDEFTYRWK